MKTIQFFKNSMKASIHFMFAAALTAGFTACDNEMLEESDPRQETSVEQPKSIYNLNFNDLSVLLNTIAEIDDNGQVVSHNYGEALYAENPTHLFIGVDKMEEAKDMFELWMAPDVRMTKHADGSISAELRDELGHMQGNVFLNPGTEENHIAEVTTDISQNCFSRITFLKNEAWPSGKLRANQYRYCKFDIVEDVTMKDITEWLKPADRKLNFVCIQGSSNGVKPIFCAITKETYVNPVKWDNIYNLIRGSQYCPALSTASSIQKILLKDWSIFTQIFKEVGCGPLVGGTEYWIDDTHDNFFWFYNEVMDYHSGYTYGEKGDVAYRFLLKMNNLNDYDIYDGMSF